MSNLVKVGVLPGRITEVSVDSTTTVQDAIDFAELTVGDYEVKVDGVTVTDLSASAEGAGMILLAKKVKGN